MGMDPEKRREYNRKYREKMKELCKTDPVFAREYRERRRSKKKWIPSAQSKVKILNYRREWYQKNRDRVLELGKLASARRKLRKEGNEIPVEIAAKPIGRPPDPVAYVFPDVEFNVIFD